MPDLTGHLDRRGEVPSESSRIMIWSAMNWIMFLDLIHSSRFQMTEREYDKITSRVEKVISSTKLWRV